MTSETLPQNTKRSSVSTKLFLIVAVCAMPVGLLVYLLASSYSPQIASAQLELSGNALQRPLMRVLYGLSSAENVLQACETGNCATDFSTQSTIVSANLDTASALNVQFAADLSTSNDALAKKNHKDLAFDNLQSEWSDLRAASGKISTPAERAELASGLDHLAAKVRQLVGYIGDSSRLVLDPDLASKYLVNVTLVAMPETIMRISNTAAIGNKILTGAGNNLDQALLTNESSLLEESMNHIATSNSATLEAGAKNREISPTLQPKLRAALRVYQSAITGYLSTIKSLAANPSQTTAPGLAAQVAAVQKNSLDYWETSANELDMLLNMRVYDLQASRVQALGISAVAVAIAGIVVFLIGRSITRPLQELVRDLGPGAMRLGVSVDRIAEASHSQIPSQQESQRIFQELNAEAEKMRKAVLELAQHVEGSAAASRSVSPAPK